MAKVHYRIVAHDGGWAYKLNDVFSEPFPSKVAALAAAKEPPPRNTSPATPSTSNMKTKPADGTLNCPKEATNRMPMWLPDECRDK
jgi:hypothetical protein